MTRRLLRLLAIFCCLLFFQTARAGSLASMIAPTTQKQETNTQQQAQADQGDQDQPITLVEINTHINELPKKLIDLKKILADAVDVDAVRAQLPELRKQIDKISWQVAREKSNPSLSYTQLADIAASIESLHRQLRDLEHQVDDSLEALGREEKIWHREKERLEEWKKQARQTGPAQLLLQRQQSPFSTVDGALKEIRQYLARVVKLSREISALDVRLYGMKTDLEGLIKDARAIHFEQTAPSIFSARFYRSLNKNLFQTFVHNVRRAVTIQQHYIQAKAAWVFLEAGIIILLSLAIYHSRKLVETTNRWYLFSRQPIATALFVSLTSLVLATMIFSARHLVAEVEEMLYIIVIASLMRLSKVLVNTWLRTRLLLPISVVLLLSLLLQMFHVPAPLTHLYIFVVSILALVGYVIIMVRCRSRVFGLNLMFLHLAGLCSLIITVAEIAGYSAISVYLFRSFLYSVVAALVFWLLFVITQALLELLFFRVPLKLLQRNSNVLVRYCVPALSFFYSLLFFLVCLVIWQVYPTIEEAATSLANLGFDLGGFHVTPGYILTVYLVIYGAFMFSRLLQALLLQEVLPRYGVAKGVQLSITRLVHYAVMVTGAIILLRVLGLELSKLALVGGALSVGIGFGLQAIVNNFASGLILLFERPLKVGDMVQVGTELGEVKKLGLRATVVRTFDNADIVIPNSDLITGRVTNWTLGDRHLRVKIPVGVAYGTDIAKVFEILLRCAENNPMVLNQPRPKALFLAFGASSLDFELRVWIGEFTDRRQVLSELNQEIESEFADAGIEIPFPQTDLHLRSVDEQALQGVRAVCHPDPGAPGQQADANSSDQVTTGPEDRKQEEAAQPEKDCTASSE